VIQTDVTREIKVELVLYQVHVVAGASFGATPRWTDAGNPDVLQWCFFVWSHSTRAQLTISIFAAENDCNNNCDCSKIFFGGNAKRHEA
jgi:hypothetical protein